MTNATIGRHKKHILPIITMTTLHRDDFVHNLLPWLIGIPVSLILIRVFSL